MSASIEGDALLLLQELQKHYEDYMATEKHMEETFRMPESFGVDFFHIIDRVTLSLMEDTDNFYGYFSFQMKKAVRFDIAGPTAVSFKSAAYVLYFNPFLFLPLTAKQMATAIKHDILHIVSLHLIRARDLKDTYSKRVLNIAMDVVVNTYLKNLPPDAITLQWVNMQYGLFLPPFETFEYYAEKIQAAVEIRQRNTPYTGSDHSNSIQLAFDPETTHDVWEESDELDTATLQKFTEKYIDAARKGSLSNYLESMIAELKKEAPGLPWSLYVKKFTGAVAAEKKKTVTRRNRRQPERLDLRGKLTGHTARLLVALDISGSISDSEFKQAMVEVLEIVKNFKHEITLVECDDEIRRSYPIKTLADLQPRLDVRGGTRFSPVFAYANSRRIDVLIYFTDGKGEQKLQVPPKNYKVLWVLTGDALSLKEPHGIIKYLKPDKSDDANLDFDNVEKGGYSMNNQEKILL